MQNKNLITEQKLEIAYRLMCYKIYQTLWKKGLIEIFKKNKAKSYSPRNSVNIVYKGKGKALKDFRPFSKFIPKPEIHPIAIQNSLVE